MNREPESNEVPDPPLDLSRVTPLDREGGRRRVVWWPGLLVAVLVAGSVGLVAARLDTANGDLRRSLTEAEAASAAAAAKAKDDAARAKVEADAAIGKTADTLRDTEAVRDAHLATAQLMRVASLYKTDPLGAVALLHDHDAFPIDRRDAAWHFYANCCERRLRPDMLGKVIATSVHGRRHNIYPVPHRAADGRVLALVETPDAKWKVMDLASGEVVRPAHPDLQKRGGIHALSINGNTVAVWTKGKDVKNAETGKVETPSEYGFMDVETGQWHKLRLDSSRGILTPDGRRFAVDTPLERVLYDVSTGDSISKIAHGEQFEKLEGTTAVSADGKYIASFVKSEKTPGIVRIIDAQSNKELAQVAPPKREIELFRAKHALTHPEVKLGIELLQFSPDGKKLVIAYRYYGKTDIPEYYVECHVISVPDGIRIGVHDVSSAEFPTYVAFNQDGSRLAVCCGVGSGFGGPRGTLGVYRADPGKNGDYLLPVVHKFAWPIPVPHQKAHDSKGSDWGSIRGLSFAPDDSRVALAVQTDGGYHVVEADVLSGRLRLLPGSLPHEFGRENTDANAHISSRNELFVVTEFGTLHRWRLTPDDATATLPHAPPHPKLRLADTEIGFDKQDPRLFVRYHYSHWHNGKERIANPPQELLLVGEQHDAQWYRHFKSLEPRAWKPRGLTDPAPAQRAFPENEPPPPPVSPDGRTRATALVNGDIELWDVPTNRLRATLESRGRPVKALRFSPDGRALASLDTSHVVKVWDFGPPALYGQWQGTAAAFSPDEKTLAVGGHLIDRGPLKDFKTVTFFDLKTGQVGGHIKSWGDPTSMAYSTDGEVLAVGDTLFTRDATEWKEVEVSNAVLFPGEVRAFLPEARILAMVSSFETWAVKPEQALLKHVGAAPGEVTVLHAKSPVGRRASLSNTAIGYHPSDKTMVVVQLRDGVGLEVAQFDSASGKRMQLRTVPNSTSRPDLWTVLPGGESVVATDRTTGGEFVKLPVSLQVIDLKTGAGSPLPGDHTGGCTRVGVSPDGHWLASGDGLGVVRVWDLRTRKLVKEFWAHGNGIERLVFSPSGRHLAVIGADKMVRVWDLAVPGHDQ